MTITSYVDQTDRYSVTKQHAGTSFQLNLMVNERSEATLIFTMDEGIATELIFWRSPSCSMDHTYEILLGSLAKICSMWLSPEVDIASQDFDLWNYHAYDQYQKRGLTPFVLIGDKIYNIQDEMSFVDWSAERHSHWMKFIPAKERVRLRFGIAVMEQDIPLQASDIPRISRDSAVNPNADFITEDDRKHGWVSGSIRTRMGKQVFELIRNWALPPEGRHFVPKNYRLYTGPNIAKPFRFVVKDMPVSVWDALISRHGFHTDLERL